MCVSLSPSPGGNQLSVAYLKNTFLEPALSDIPREPPRNYFLNYADDIKINAVFMHCDLLANHCRSVDWLLLPSFNVSKCMVPHIGLNPIWCTPIVISVSS